MNNLLYKLYIKHIFYNKKKKLDVPYKTLTSKQNKQVKKLKIKHITMY